MPAAAAPARKSPGKENVLTRKIGPLPMWAWTGIAAAIVLLYVVLHKSSSSSNNSNQGGGKATGLVASLVPPVVIHGGGGHRRRDDDDKKKHHRKKKDEPEDKESKEAEQDERHHKPRAKRGAPEQNATAPAGTVLPAPVQGSLVSFTAPQAGPTPSLAQIAADNNTAPDAIVEEATGRGSPHGAMWRRYVALHDWDAPVPHGTDMTILAQPGG
jgi:hypothetical protein